MIVQINQTPMSFETACIWTKLLRDFFTNQEFVLTVKSSFDELPRVYPRVVFSEAPKPLRYDSYGLVEIHYCHPKTRNVVTNPLKKIWFPYRESVMVGGLDWDDGLTEVFSLTRVHQPQEVIDKLLELQTTLRQHPPIKSAIPA
jgi:hypothetical protein